MELGHVLAEMGEIYRDDPVKAVRGKSFINVLHSYLVDELRAHLTPWAIRRGIKVVTEARILGSHKPKDVDVAIVDPENGPLVLVGVRSQMSSIGKNVLTYYEGIVGECISLQDRFPMATHGYVYLHPLKAIKVGKEKEVINHSRYANLYDAITGRDGVAYKEIRGIYDQFAYMVVDFKAEPPELRDDTFDGSVVHDLSVTTFVQRIVDTARNRMLFWDVFEEPT